jgi:hypothetical protein
MENAMKGISLMIKERVKVLSDGKMGVSTKENGKTVSNMV